MLGFVILDTEGYRAPMGDEPWGVWCLRCTWKASYPKVAQLINAVGAHLLIHLENEGSHSYQ